MHTETLKKLALALTFWLALHLSALRAQTTSAPPLTVSNTGANSVDLEFRLDGTFIAKGNFGIGSLLAGDEGAGTRMVWFPSLAAFRAGYVDGTQWDEPNIGPYSTALGYDATASGYGSIALGYSVTSSRRDYWPWGAL